MKANMGSTDKAIRIIVAIALGVLIYTEVFSSTVAYVLLAIAAVFVLTSFISFCPLYKPFGISTCKAKK
jgi:hypothetical protein